AWGCGAFGNDPERTAADFRDALASEYAGAFDEVVFAITDWSTERRFLGPFRDVMTKGAAVA
ncbi:MAG: TIGR02452 family protein, partial [Vicinamibacterales bacterium]